MEKQCSVCKKAVDSESAAILTMGGFGNPRYICDGCDADFALATGAKDIEKISSAMDRISKKLAESDIDDKLVLKSVEDIMAEASARAEKIKEGTYDFAEEETEANAADEEVPEELRETEEDRELDRQESERNKKLDKIMNWISLAIFILVLGFAAYKLITAFI